MAMRHCSDGSGSTLHTRRFAAHPVSRSTRLLDPAEHLNGPGTYFYPDIDGKPATPHMLDSVSNALNFVSQLLLLNRFLEQWLLWITIGEHSA